ncbi:hypothetical protein GUITHDRAFT_119133 [Guillardia theta CCMP2712]|uniref:Uncharacterized protein n=1 Tax=Guillardia theta (strain CCMP2712) TaxID=905079 RepID=L1IFT7_GUITC|nr:hypothetical protein GUITHDRAFT_119133 [Guillardia theta CCMP2712]EKX34700.1 hypothetical protein GUITHDRAFT_119133 [Guillardia theta CCMP2712]|eukprot:XP_005821680.1 hypothetical protein GUITHDRAFT_119133 [Guillardia theta CCMP2712]
MAGRNVKAKGQGREKMLEELREKCRRRLKDERKNLVDTLRGLAQGKNVLDMHQEQLEAVRDFTRNLIERVKMDEGINDQEVGAFKSTAEAYPSLYDTISTSPDATVEEGDEEMLTFEEYIDMMTKLEEEMILDILETDKHSNILAMRKMKRMIPLKVVVTR